MPFVPHGNFSGRRLVVFGCGYVGSAVAKHVLRDGGTVTAVVRQPAAADALRAPGIEAVVADVATTDWHKAVGGPADFVLNSLSAGASAVEAYQRTYLHGMQSIIQWARNTRNVGTIVYTSSTSVYPQGGGVAVDESRPVSGSTEQSKVLVETEDVLRGSMGACDRWFILRLSGIYGPARHHLLDQIRTGTVAGNGEHHLNVVYLDDIVAAICACFRAPEQLRNEVFNVADDEPARKKDVVAWLASRMAVPVPAFTGLPAGSRRAVTPDRMIANAKLRTVLGWSPQFPSYREGYEAILDHSH